jgi:hypothetical protein
MIFILQVGSHEVTVVRVSVFIMTRFLDVNEIGQFLIHDRLFFHKCINTVDTYVMKSSNN